MGRYAVPSMTVTTFRRKGGSRKNPYGYRFRSRNGKIVVWGEGHPTRSKARRAAKGLIKAVGGTPKSVNWRDE